MRVQFFGTCLVDTFFPETGEAAVKLLQHFGCEVIYPPGQTCCGKPADSGGYSKSARRAAKHFLSVFEREEPLVIPSGSCASMVKNHYPELFKNDDKLFKKSEALADRTFELSRFLVGMLQVHESDLRGSGKITYHASCQLTRELGVLDEPLLLIKSIRGAEYVPLPYMERCCGFGGIFMAKLPEVSMALAEEKADDVIGTGADILVGCDHGCLMNIADALKRKGSSVAVKHIAVLVAESLGL